MLRDWRSKLDGFLQFNQREVLTDAGTVSREVADRHALNQYQRFEERRRLELEAKGEAELAAGFAELEGKAKELPPARRKGRRK